MKNISATAGWLVACISNLNIAVLTADHPLSCGVAVLAAMCSMWNAGRSVVR